MNTILKIKNGEKNMEIWKSIPDYEGLYEVSNFGNIKSIKRNKILKARISNGYLRITLHKNKKMKSFFVHRLVANSFIDNPDNKNQINHKDENKLNNNVNNLEWCNADYNNNYGSRNKKISASMKGHKCKHSVEVICLTMNDEIVSIYESAQ